MAILLHCCCAPCAIPAIIELKTSDHAVDCYYFNPNIKPKDEYFKRLAQLKKVCAHFGVKLFVSEYEAFRFDDAVLGLENDPEGGARCEICFNLRLNQAALFAKSGGYDAFCTTLTTSALKNATLINKIGGEIGLNFGINYLPSDFKKKNGNLISKSVCKELGIYRQNYCGCTEFRIKS